MQRYDRSSVFPFNFPNMCQQYILPDISNCYWINLKKRHFNKVHALQF